MTYLDIARAQLSTDEGYRKKPYRDTVGKITIGVGRNLDDVGLHDDEIGLLLDNDLSVADRAAKALVPTFESLSDARKAVVVQMAFNMGQVRLSGFVNTLLAIRDGRWNDAADGMLASQWAVQVGARAQRLAQAMREG